MTSTQKLINETYKLQNDNSPKILNQLLVNHLQELLIFKLQSDQLMQNNKFINLLAEMT